MNSQRYTDREINLHTHSFYCGHGHGHIAEYVQAAASTSLKALGFSEHCPFPDDRYRSTRRMPIGSATKRMSPPARGREI